MNISLYDKPKAFINTEYFTEASRNFIKNGYYCPYPDGTYAHKEFWDEETRRRIEGYTVGGVTITGRHYGYLNYAQIKLVDDDEIKIRRAKKTVTFPRFWDTDYEYFWELEKCEQEGKHMILAKARRKGFSYKNGWLCANEFDTVRNSTCIIAAYLDNYSSATMNMSLEYLNFLNKHTDWAKARFPDSKDYVRAAFPETINGIDVISGYKSEIMKMSFKDNPFKSIGKSADIFLFEEAGKFPNLKSSWMFTRPTLEDGSLTTGLAIMFGTGGDVEGSTADFADMFYHPETYGFRAYDNRWDEDGAGKTCGLFIPHYASLKGYMDKDGNSDILGAIESEEKKRDITRKGAKNSNTITKQISQSPFTPREAFLRTTGNIFPVLELSEHLGRLETDSKATNFALTGDLVWEEGGDKVKWKMNPNKIPITDFPLKEDVDKEGCVVIWETPFTDSNGQIPFGLYIAGNDPYDQNQAEFSPSLGSMFIYKTFISAGKTHNIIVAEYTGRPDRADEFYENCRKLLVYYNAICLYENQLTGLKAYFETKRCLHLLKPQPSILADIVKDSKVERGYGIHMNKEIKSQCEIYLKDWLTERVTDADGKEKLNLHNIYSLALLKELIAYNNTGNFDRVIAFMLCILHLKDNHRVIVQEAKEFIDTDPFWTRDLFKQRFNN